MRRVLFGFLVAVFPSAAPSATFTNLHFVTYSLNGSALTGCHEGSASFATGPCPPELSETLPQIGIFDGSFTIDEGRLGHTLISATIDLGLPSTSVDGDGNVTRSPGGWEAIVATNLGLPILDLCCGGSFRLETDSQRRPVSWSFDLLGGPPDWGTFSGGFSYIVSGAYALTGPSGVLQLEGVAPIPLPPAAALLAGGLLGLGVVVRRRRRSGTTTADSP